MSTTETPTAKEPEMSKTADKAIASIDAGILAYEVSQVIAAAQWFDRNKRRAILRHRVTQVMLANQG